MPFLPRGDNASLKLLGQVARIAFSLGFLEIKPLRVGRDGPVESCSLYSVAVDVRRWSLTLGAREHI